MPRPRKIIATLAIGLCLSAAAIRPGTAQSAEPFYKGKTINFLVAIVPADRQSPTASIETTTRARCIGISPSSVCYRGHFWWSRDVACDYQ